MLCLICSVYRNIVFRPYFSKKKYHAFKESHQAVWLKGGGGGLSYCTAKTASLMKEVLFS